MARRSRTRAPALPPAPLPVAPPGAGLLGAAAAPLPGAMGATPMMPQGPGAMGMMPPGPPGAMGPAPAANPLAAAMLLNRIRAGRGR